MNRPPPRVPETSPPGTENACARLFDGKLRLFVAAGGAAALAGTAWTDPAPAKLGVAAGLAVLAWLARARARRSRRARRIAAVALAMLGAAAYWGTLRPEALVLAAAATGPLLSPSGSLAGGALLVAIAALHGAWPAAGAAGVAALGAAGWADALLRRLGRRARWKRRLASAETARRAAVAKALNLEALTQESGAIVMESQARMAAEIRKQQRTEEELREARDRLEETNTRLLDAVDRANALALKAEAANEAKGNFLATMSHEIRTPLNGVLGTADLLLEDELTPAQRSSLETIRSSGNNLLAILNDVLDFSRIESGQLELENIPFSPARCMRETLQLFYGRAQARRLRLRMTVCPDVPETVRGDAGRIRQVLANFVSNAIKFTERGEVELGVERLNNAGPNRLRLCFSVRDTGVGIPHEKQRLLFKPFSQLDASTRRRYGGTGLGLAICRRIAEVMDGDVSVESTVGAGSIFRCTVVLNLAEEAAREALPPAPAGRSLVKRILVVDDERINQQIVSAMLAKLGHKAEVARNGLEALEALRSRDYEIIFMDWHMPEMNGLDATRAIRNELNPAHQPWIIALTASAQPQDREKCIGAGMNDYLTKPLNLEALREAFARFEACESS